MARKKNPKTKKTTSEKDKSNSFTSHLLIVFEQIISYFELLFVYYRKKFNEGARRSFLIVFVMFYCLFILLVGTGMFVHAGYLALQNLFSGDIMLTSISMGSLLFVISFFLMYSLLKKIIF